MDVILVDEKDQPVGTMEKMEVHQKALLHRAFSIFIFNDKGEMLLQQRAADKYHSAGLWTNACCSHPRPGADLFAAAKQRLQEEMGFSTPLKKVFDFIYKAPYENGLTEYEFDHVLLGYYSGRVEPDPAEVSDFYFSSMPDIKKAMRSNAKAFTAWFHIAFPKLETYLAANKIDPVNLSR